ncbi:MAG: DNA recombination protein RmuC [Planctomycetales bacterium]|nr:DNA recombination protein RmuC [Planctomycetales bacterium]
METLVTLVVFVAGAGIGLLVGWKVRGSRLGSPDELAAGIMKENEARFTSIAADLLSRTTTELQRMNEERHRLEKDAHASELDNKKGLIDQQLKAITAELTKVTQTVRDFEKDREVKFGELSKQIQMTGRQTEELRTITGSLKEALASGKTRGNWGERMVEDILRLVGMQKGMNYEKHKTVAGGTTRPDFTFLMPESRILNLDSKFPFDNYARYIEARNQSERDAHGKLFLKNVRDKIQECSSKDYINEQTVDYVLLFVPNESVYAFIHEQHPGVIDEALSQKVVLCSPLTLYAVLSVIRQSIGTFALEKKSHKILALLAHFRKEWQKFAEQLEKLGRKIDSAHKEYESLATTRSRALERPLAKIDEIEGNLLEAPDEARAPANLDEPEAEDDTGPIVRVLG